MHRPFVLALVLIVSLSSSSSTSAQPSDTVPPNLAVPGGHFTAFGVWAEGVQIYDCQARADNPMAFEWTFRAPEASLMSLDGEPIGSHYAGPTWEALDGSKIVAAAHANADSPDPAAIPWLLLEAQSNSGTGLFSTVTYIQRLDTSGGRAPADGCGASTVGQEARVPYTATYTFSYPTASS
jgi:hypothetical protein